MYVEINKIYTWFNNHYRLKKSTQGWYSFDCPYCDGVGKMAVNFRYGLVKCWKCDSRARLLDFIGYVEGISWYDARIMLATLKSSSFKIDTKRIERIKTNVNLPEGFNHILDGDTVIAKRARKYLKSRGFDLVLLDKMGFGYCEYGEYFGYIIIPFYREGSLIYYIGRDYIGNFLRYRNPSKGSCGVGKSSIIFNEVALKVENKLFITEGWADAVTLGDQGTATLGWSLSDYQKSLYIKAYASDLVFVPDKGFYKQAIKTASMFLDYKNVYVVNTDNILPGSEAKDANEIGKKLILEELSNTEKLNMSKVLEVIL